jgi:hypothetical protein
MLVCCQLVNVPRLRDLQEVMNTIDEEIPLLSPAGANTNAPLYFPQVLCANLLAPTLDDDVTFFPPVRF